MSIVTLIASVALGAGGAGLFLAMPHLCRRLPGAMSRAWFLARERDPAMRHALRIAIEDGFDPADEPFESLAASRDTALASLTSSFSDEPDLFDFASMLRFACRYRFGMIDLAVSSNLEARLVSLLEAGPDEVAASVDLSGLGLKTSRNGGEKGLGELAMDELEFRLGTEPDLPTMAAIALFVRNIPGVHRATVDFPRKHARARDYFLALSALNPTTGRPYVSIAEAQTALCR